MENKVKFEYNGKSYIFKPSKLVEIIEFYNKNMIKIGMTECPLCGCDFFDNNLFVCEECGELKERDELCPDHNYLDICKDCCEICKEENAYNDYIDSLIDFDRGK